MRSTNNLPFINFSHGIDNTRLYKIDDELYCSTVTREAIKPFVTTGIKEMAEYLDNVINGGWGIVNLNFCYPRGFLTKNKQKKLRKLLEEQGQVETQRLIRYITLLV